MRPYRSGTDAMGISSCFNSWVISRLKNRAYVGDAVWNKRTSAKFYRVLEEHAVERDEQSSEKLERNDADEQIIKEDAHRAIVSREVFYKARAAPTQGCY